MAPYKFALHLALADIAIERGDDSGASLTVSVAEIAEKFVQYYWRQAAPYMTPYAGRILRQNTRQQAAIVNRVAESRGQHGNVLTAVMHLRLWKPPVREVTRVVKGMQLWNCRPWGRRALKFLYANNDAGNTVELRAGVAHCFRKFCGSITDLMHAAWARYVRQQNRDVLGETADLNEFLFGSERARLRGRAPGADGPSARRLLVLWGRTEGHQHARGTFHRLGAVSGGPRPQLRPQWEEARSATGLRPSGGPLSSSTASSPSWPYRRGAGRSGERCCRVPAQEIEHPAHTDLGQESIKPILGRPRCWQTAEREREASPVLQGHPDEGCHMPG